jgi:hypothetical protein
MDGPSSSSDEGSDGAASDEDDDFDLDEDEDEGPKKKKGKGKAAAPKGKKQSAAEAGAARVRQVAGDGVDCVCRRGLSGTAAYVAQGSCSPVLMQAGCWPGGDVAQGVEQCCLVVCCCLLCRAPRSLQRVRAHQQAA